MFDDPIVAAFAKRLADAPEAAIVRTPTRTISRAALDRLAGRASRVLLPRFEPGALLAIDAANGPTLIAAFIALRRAGLVPLLLDASAPVEQKRQTAEVLGASGTLRCSDPWGAAECSFDCEPTPSGQAPQLTPEIGAVKLTSGTSGAPRGVVARARTLIADEAQLWTTMGLDAHDRALVAIPLTHSYGFSSLLLPALIRGLCLVMPDQPGPLTALTAGERCGATFFPTVPAWLAALIKISAPPAWPASIRLVIAAGAPLRAEVARAVRERFGIDVRVFYGASECGGISFDRIGGAAERGTVGTPVDGVTIEFDPDGVVQVRSAAVADGYLPAEGNRLQPGLFRSGDLATLHGAELKLCGRADDLINVKGKKVSPREIETVIAALDGVDDVAVLAVEAAGGETVIRALVAAGGRSLSYEQVAEWCRRHLADHKVPRSILIVDSLPRTERGKLDRAAISS